LRFSERLLQNTRPIEGFHGDNRPVGGQHSWSQYVSCDFLGRICRFADLLDENRPSPHRDPPPRNGFGDPQTVGVLCLLVEVGRPLIDCFQDPTLVIEKLMGEQQELKTKLAQRDSRCRQLEVSRRFPAGGRLFD